MKFDIITAFPKAFSYLQESIPKRAQEKGKVEIQIHDLRKYGIGKWKQIDDRPFGGGPGMLLMIEPIYRCLKDIGVYPKRDEKTKVLLMSARGQEWEQSRVEEYRGRLERIVLICGHYEGVDERVVENLIDEEVSIGRYILSGGELASMVIIDSITRTISDVIGKSESLERETQFVEGKKLVEYPHYTRPEIFETDESDAWPTPKILLSGDHGEVEKWKLENTKQVD